MTQDPEHYVNDVFTLRTYQTVLYRGQYSISPSRYLKGRMMYMVLPLPTRTTFEIAMKARRNLQRSGKIRHKSLWCLVAFP